MAGLYIHIPFCASRCIYCDFYSTTGRNRIHFIDRVLEEAKKEIANKSHSFPAFDSFKTVYIGGGTPSQLSSEELHSLINGLSELFDLSQVEEFTMEVNPEDITEQYVAKLPNVINRISMGIQSFVDSELKILKRRHNADQPKKAIQLLKRKGIKNISIDLMYGLPQQTMESFAYSIDQALKLEVQHISGYNLTIEEGTQIYNLLKAQKLAIADDELCNDMNSLLKQKLQEAGFEQYEISNYSLPGYESKHNSSYWDGTPYLGLGPGAHSYNGMNLRWWNDHNLDGYLAGNCLKSEETLSNEDLFNERIMLGLRTRKGVNMEQIKNTFPSLYDSAFLPALELNRNRLHIEDGFLRIAPDAQNMTDAITESFFSIQ